MVVWVALAVASCGDNSSNTGGSGGTAGSGGMSGSGGSGGTGGMIDAPVDAAEMADAGPPDAAFSDAGVYSTPVTNNAVACLLSSQAPCTTPSTVCCVERTDAGTMDFMCNAPAQCPSTARFDLACDGPEDCPGGQTCCGSPVAADNGFTTVCVAGTTCPTGRIMCHNHTECPAAMSSCCTRNLGGGLFTGRCFAPGTEPAFSGCDTP